MDYKIVVSQRANEQLEEMIAYIISKLQNKQAARAVYDDIMNAYDKLEYMAGTVAVCEDPYLAAKGYRRLALEHHDYVLLYQMDGNVVYVNGIFHMLEDYQNKIE